MAYDQQQARIDRQNLIAQALRDSGNIPNSRVNQTAGGFVVPISPFETITKLLEQGVGAYAGYKTGQNQDALNAQKDKDKQAAISGLMDSLAGPSQMGQAPGATPQPDPAQPPVGATTNFDPSSQGAGSAQPQQPTLPPSGPTAAPTEQNQKRAAMAALLQGQPSDQIIQSLQGAALKQFEPKADYSLKNDEERISGTTNQPIATGLPKEYKPAAEDRALVNVVDQKAPNGYRSIERQNFKEGTDQLYQKPSAGDAAAAGFTGDALDNAGQRYRMFGELPAGAGKSPAMAIKIMNRAAEQAHEAGDDAGAAAIRQKAGVATTGALKKFEGTAQAIGGFEKLATKSADLAEQLADKVGAGGVPVLNQWQQSATKNFTPGSDLAKFHAQTETFSAEYGKIMSGSMGNSALSDSAAEHARGLINTAMDNKTYHDVMKTLRQDMANRIKAQSEERVELYAQLSGHGPDNIPGNKPPATEVPAVATTPAVAGVPADIQALLDKHGGK